MIRRKAAFTLVETLCVVVIVGISIVLFYTTLTSSGDSMDNYATRANLWQDMDKIIDRVTDEARLARSVNVSSDKASVAFVDAAGNIFFTGAFSSTGIFTITGSGSTEVLTDRVDPALSSFDKQGNALVVTMVLADNVSSRRVEIHASTEILPRN